MSQERAAASRVHALDALRVVACLSVLYLHCTLSFLVTFWAGILDGSSTVAARTVMRETYELLHSFVLPSFFLTAGFLARRLCERNGPLGMLRERTQRILLPFLAGVLIAVPLIDFLQQAGTSKAAGQGLAAAWRHFQSGVAQGDFWRQFGPHYLWFLSYLMIFCVVTVVLRAVVCKAGLGGLVRAWGDAVVAFACRSRWAPLALCVPLMGLMLFIRGPTVAEAGHDFIPEPAIWTIYWISFLFGWFLHRSDGGLAKLAQRWRFNVGSGMVVWLAATLVLTVALTEETDFRVPPPTIAGEVWQPPPRPEGPPPAPSPVLPVYHFMKAYLSWALTFGLLGLFYRLDARPVEWLRFLSDSSYWVYLAHAPLVVALQIVVATWPVVWWVKLPLVYFLVLGPLLVVYRYAVRSTWIGQWLNGRRHRPGMPADHRQEPPLGAPVDTAPAGD